MKRSKFRLDNQHPFRIYREPIRQARGINGPFIQKEAAKFRSIEQAYKQSPPIAQPSVIKLFQPSDNPITVNSSPPLRICLANANREGIRITNVGTSVIYIGIDRQPSNLSYDHILPGCSTAGDGTGGVLVDDAVYKGEIWVISSVDGGLIALVEKP